MAYYGGGGQPPPQYCQPVLREPHGNYGAGPPQGYPGHPTGPGPAPAAPGAAGRVPPPPPQLSNYNKNNGSNGYQPYQHQPGSGGDPYGGGYAPQHPPHQQQEQHPPQYGHGPPPPLAPSGGGYHDAGQGGGGYGYGGQQQQPPPQAGYYHPHPHQIPGGQPPPHQFNGQPQSVQSQSQPQPGQGQAQVPITVAQPAESPKNVSKMVTMTGIVTQMQPGAFGMISEEIFFQDGLVSDGLTLKVGDKVVVEAEPVSGMPFKYNAKKVTKLDVDLVSSVSDRGHLRPPPLNQYNPESPSPDLGPLPSLPSSLNLPKPVPVPYLTDSTFLTSMGQGQGHLPPQGQNQDQFPGSVAQPKPLKSILKNRNPPPPPVLSSTSTSAPVGVDGSELVRDREKSQRSRAHHQHRHQAVAEPYVRTQAPPTSFSIDLDRTIPRVLPGGPGHRLNDPVEFAEYTYINKERPPGMPLPASVQISPQENQNQRPESRSPQVTRLLPKSPIPEYGGGRDREEGKKKNKHRSRSRSRSKSPSPSSRNLKSERSNSRPHRKAPPRSRSRSPSSRTRRRRSMSRSKSRSISPDIRRKSRSRRSRSKSRSRSRSVSKDRKRRVRRSRSKSKSRSRSISKDRKRRVRRSRSRSRSKSRDHRRSSRPSTRRSRSRSRSDSKSRSTRATRGGDGGQRSPNSRTRRRSSSGSSIMEISPRPSREDNELDANNEDVTVLGKTVTHGIVVKRVVSNLFPRLSDRGFKAGPKDDDLMIKLGNVKDKILNEAHSKLNLASSASKNSGPVPIKFQISNPAASKPGTGTTLPNPIFSRAPPPLPDSGKQAFINLCKTIQNDDPGSRKKKKKEQEPAFKIVDRSKVTTSTESSAPPPPEKFSAEEKIRQWEAERQQLKRIIVDKIGLANQAKNNKYSDPTAVQKLRMTIQNDLNELKYKEAEIAAANAVVSKSKNAQAPAPVPEIMMPENPAEIQQLKETLQRDLSQRSRSKSQEKEKDKAGEKTEQTKHKNQVNQEITKKIGDGVQQALKDLRSKFETKKNETQVSTSTSNSRVSPPPPPTRRPRSRSRSRSRTPPAPLAPPPRHQDEAEMEDDDPYYDGIMAYDPVLEKVMEEIHKQRFMEEKERLRYNGDQAALDSLYYMNDRRTRRGKEMHLIYLRKQEAQMKRDRDYKALDRLIDQYGPEAKRRQQEEDLREFRIQEERKTPRVQMEAIRRQEEEYYAWLEDEGLARIRSSRNRGGEGRVLRRRTPSPGPSTSRGGGGHPHPPHEHPYPHPPPPHGYPHPPPVMDYGHDDFGYGYYGGDGGPPPPGHWMEGGGWHPEMEDDRYHGRGDYGRFPMPR